jgi:hypothetical protein
MQSQEEKETLLSNNIAEAGPRAPRHPFLGDLQRLPGRTRKSEILFANESA